MQCTNPITLFPKRDNLGRYKLDPDKYSQGLVVSCGKCLACRIKRTEEWTIRLLHELSEYDKSVFVTLTYDVEHLPKGNSGFGSLRKSDLQKFFKRLRRRLECEERSIKYYACGEYGEEKDRPHYHAIILGLSNSRDDKSIIDDAWKLGGTYYGSAEVDSIRYVAKYIQKQSSGVLEIQDYNEKSREKVFKLSSLGIGKRYCEKFSDQIKGKGYITHKGVKLSIPRYYLEKLGLSRLEEFKIKVKELSDERQRLKNEENFGVKFTDAEAYKGLTTGEYAVIDRRKSIGRNQHNKNLNAKLNLRKGKL